MIQYVLLVVVLVVLWLWFRSMNYTPTNPMQTQMVAWQGLLAAIVVGALGVLGLNALGLPAIWDERATVFQKVLSPVLIGLVLGGWGLLNSKLLGSADATTSTSVPFPASVPLYVLGNAQTEIFFRLGLLTLLIALGRWVFPNLTWLPVAVMALVETGAAFMSFKAGGGKMDRLNVVPSILFFLALSVVQSVQFIQVGFIAPLLTRITLGIVGEIIAPMLKR